MPPVEADHVYTVIVGRTLNLNEDDTQVGVRGVHYVDEVIEGTTRHRHTSVYADSTIAAVGQIDNGFTVPRTCRTGCSWRSRVVYAGLEDANVVEISDVGYFGQIRVTYRAVDAVVKVGAAGDRLIIVTRTTTEVLWETPEGLIAVLSQDFSRGSLYGRSFVDVGGALFGYWSTGPGIFDGVEFKPINTPFFLGQDYIVQAHNITTSVLFGKFILVSVRKDVESDVPNYVLMLNLKSLEWYLLKESVFDMVQHDGNLYGCDDTIYHMFRGEFPASRLEIRGLVPEGSTPIYDRTINDVRLLMLNSSNEELDAEIESSGVVSVSREARMLGPRMFFNAKQFPVHYWNEPSLLYTTEPAWNAETPTMIQLNTSRTVFGNSVDMAIDFPGGHLISLSAIVVQTSSDHRGK
jgi:hypothetical protein